MLVLRTNRSLRIHHPNTFDEICIEKNVSSIELQCKELWNVKNGISICYRCHKDVEKLRTKLRNMFRLQNFSGGHVRCLALAITDVAPWCFVSSACWP